MLCRHLQFLEDHVNRCVNVADMVPSGKKLVLNVQPVHISSLVESVVNKEAVSMICTIISHWVCLKLRVVPQSC